MRGLPRYFIARSISSNQWQVIDRETNQVQMERRTRSQARFERRVLNRLTAEKPTQFTTSGGVDSVAHD